MTNQPRPEKIALVKVPNLKDMTPEELSEWAAQLHAKLVAKLQKSVSDEDVEPK